MPPYSNILLKQTPISLIGLREAGISRYFFAFCVVEGISLVVHGDSAILGLIVISML